jgi:hypothetical protein
MVLSEGNAGVNGWKFGEQVLAGYFLSNYIEGFLGLVS